MVRGRSGGGGGRQGGEVVESRFIWIGCVLVFFFMLKLLNLLFWLKLRNISNYNLGFEN